MEPENRADSENAAPLEPSTAEPISPTPETAPNPNDLSPIAADEQKTAGATGDLSSGVPPAEPSSDFDSETNASENATDAERTPAEDNVPPPEPGSLEDFAQRSRKNRLSPEEESEAATLLSQLLLGGRADVNRALQSILILPWTVSSQGTTRSWPEMKPTFRSQLLAGLAKTPGESAARVRFSLARGLFKVDPAAALKLILLTLKVLRNKESGLLEGRGANILCNVLIGRGKAWLLQLPLDQLKPVETDLLVSSALHGAFHAPQPPLTQIGLLRWAAAAERLSKLPPALDQLVLRNISRWSHKWQSVLRKEVNTLPESWLTQFKIASQAKTSPPGSSPSEGHRENRKSDADEDASIPPRPREILEPLLPFPESEEEELATPHTERKRQRPARPLPQNDEESAGDADRESGNSGEGSEEEREAHEQEDSEETAPEEPQTPAYPAKTGPRPVYEPRDAHYSNRTATPNRRNAPFNLQESLRQIENHVQGLKSELAVAQRQLRLREEDKRTRRIEKPAPIPGEPSLDELNRLNQQLEFRNTELCTRIEELTADSEMRAASRNLIEENEASPDAAAQLRVLLGLKLREDFEDFQALEQEKKDLVVQQHYRSLLRHIFEVLTAEGVCFHNTESGK